MEVAHPHQGVVHEEATDLVGACVVEVDGVAPRGAMAGGEIGGELAGVVAHRAEVVVDDVEYDGESFGVAGVDEALECVGAAVVFGDSEESDAIVAPAAVSGGGG